MLRSGWLVRALRHLKREPLVAVGTIVSMAFAIGCIGALLSIVWATFVQVPPVHEPERLLSLYTRVEGDGRILPVSFPNYEDLRDRVRSFAALTAFQAIEVSVGAQHPEVVWGQMVTSNFFSVLGVRLELGRGFLPEEERELGAHRVVVLNYHFWQRKFGGDPAVVGTSVQIDGHPYEVVGVAAPEFTGTGKLINFQVWIPLGMHPEVFAWSEHIPQRDWQVLHLIGRLQPGVAPGQAEQEAQAVFAQLVLEYPRENADQRLEIVPLSESSLGVNQRDRLLRVTALLSAVTGLFLLLTCTNVSNLLLQQVLAQRQHLAVRLSLGARWSGIVGFLVFESTLLSLVGGACGIGVAVGLRSLLWHLRPPGLRLAAVYPEIDASLMFLMLGVAAFCGVAVALAPAIQLRRQDLLGLLKLESDRTSDSKGSLGMRKVLAGVQIALASLTLVCTSLMVENLVSLYNTDPGFREDVYFVTLYPKLAGLDERSGQQALEALRTALAGRTSIESVGLTESRPLKDLRTVRGILFQDDVASAENHGRLIPVTSISPGYLEALGVSVIEGRGIEDSDDERSPRVALINRTMAARHWPGRSPVGERFRFAEDPTEQITVVGVVDEFKQGSLDEPPDGLVLLPLAQYPAERVTLAVRSSVDPHLVLREVERTVEAIAPELPLIQPMSSTELLRQARAPHRLGTTLLAIFGLAALVLSGLGVFSLVAHFVQQRRTAIGIRVALGADRSQVLRLLLRQVFGPALAGLVLGLIASYAFLLRLGWFDFERASFGGAAAMASGLVAALCLVATLVPAARVTAGAATSSLREETGRRSRTLIPRLATGVPANRATKGGEIL
jgi:putative ABC transport system permease protein